MIITVKILALFAVACYIVSIFAFGYCFGYKRVLDPSISDKIAVCNIPGAIVFICIGILAASVVTYMRFTSPILVSILILLNIIIGALLISLIWVNPYRYNNDPPNIWTQRFFISISAFCVTLIYNYIILVSIYKQGNYRISPIVIGVINIIPFLIMIISFLIMFFMPGANLDIINKLVTGGELGFLVMFFICIAYVGFTM